MRYLNWINKTSHFFTSLNQYHVIIITYIKFLLQKLSQLKFCISQFYKIYVKN